MIEKDIPFEPLADFVLIRPIPRSQTAGGIALPEGVNTEPDKGRVVKVGKGRVSDDGVLVPPPVEVGDVVFMVVAYNQPMGIQIRGVEYVIVRARDLIAKDTREKTEKTSA